MTISKGAFLGKLKYHRILIVLLACLLFPKVTFSESRISEDIASLDKVHDSDRVEIYYRIYTYYRFYKPDSAHYFLEDGIKKFTNSGDRAGVASLTLWLGILDASHGNLLQAKKRQMAALEIFSSLNNKKGIGQAYNAIGIIEGRKGNWDSAGTYFFEAQKIFSEIKYEQGLSNTYTNIGNMYRNSGHPDKALIYYNRLLELANKDTSNIRVLCNAYNNIAILYGELGNLEMAVSYLQKALSKCNSEQYIDIYMYSLLNIGIVYSKFKNNEKALLYLNNALRVAKEKEMPDEYANILVNIAPITAIKDPKAGIKQLEEALAIAQMVGNKTLIKDIYGQLADLNKTIGNYREVVNLMGLMKQYDDSLASVEKAREIANLQSVYELEQSTEKIRELQLADQVSTSKRNVLLTILGGVGILVIFILLYAYKIKRLNAELTKQKSVIESANIDLNRLNTLNQKIFYVISHDFNAPLLALSLLIKKLRANNDPALSSYLDEVDNQFNSAKLILRNVLNWSKAEISMADPGTPIKADVKRAVDEVLNQMHGLATGKQISIECSNVEHGELNIPFEVLCIVLRNLLSNAIKFSSENSTVGISYLASSKQLRVTDEGVGIEKEKIQEIFKKNVVSSFGTRLEPGFGMGLFMVSELLQKYHCTIEVKSEVSKGTIFTVTFPHK